MANVLPIKQQATAKNATENELAIIQGGFGTDYMVLSERGVFRASKAYSCLVQPMLGDKVLISNISGNEHYILAIIERPETNNMTLAFPGDVALEAKVGAINLVATEQISLTSASKTQLTSSEIGVTTAKMNIQANECSVMGDKAVSQWREVNSFSSAMNLVTERLTQRIKNSFKTVEGLDQQTSLNFLQTIGKTLSIRSRDAVITARKDVKIDGERIHMG
ncbi:DUF3540 domain-containing protein [Colwellia sp. MB02u-10]|uniref:DUF3540 domain-containing protein n=1 Tax=Colwellia sp. MB02u-10 TaxID=2759828 RepID=UPI0015F4DA09|nr:DUF3540 domain-containing protein [Colwellia sp. MB02u-10]MBA6339760.1 DUF3540 domain-containing protein [Colwellia sp. MB02u-10]